MSRKKKTTFYKFNLSRVPYKKPKPIAKYLDSDHHEDIFHPGLYQNKLNNEVFTLIRGEKRFPS